MASTVTLNPVVSMLLDCLILDEPTPGRLALGLAAIAAGIVLVSRNDRDRLDEFRRWRHRNRQRRVLRRLDKRTMRDVGLQGQALPDRHRLGRPFWWLFPGR